MCLILNRLCHPFRLVKSLRTYARLCVVRRNYKRVLARLQNEAKHRKIRVLFMANELSKWKVQSLYDLMGKSGRYELMIGLHLSGRYWNYPEKERLADYERNRKYFEGLGCRCVNAVSTCEKKFDLRELNPDIIFYQQPLSEVYKECDPEEVSKYALTCYIPYFVANYGYPEIECRRWFHRMLWRHFVLNEHWVKFYSAATPESLIAGKMMGLGHTSLDAFYLDGGKTEGEDYIIYAPHWSFDHPGNQYYNKFAVGTFLETGKIILDYAKGHPEQKWVFKPHPLLYGSIVKSGAMEKAKVDRYFDEWRRIAIYHETPDYQELFMRSKAMVTDSCSFTSEYPATGKPLIHLISATAKRQPIGPNKRVYETFYRVHDVSELAKALKLVVEDGQDPKRKVRREAVREAAIGGKYAAAEILKYLNSCLQIECDEQSGGGADKREIGQARH